MNRGAVRGVAVVIATLSVGLGSDVQGARAVGLPSVTSVTPSSGPLAGGTTVTITGANYTAPLITAVKFGSTNAASFTVNSETSITAVSPVQSAGTVDVTVSTPATTSETSPADRFTYAPATVSAVEPCSGPPTGGTPVTIQGANFQGTTAVKFGSQYATNVSVNPEGSLITAVSPPGSETVDVTVTAAGAASAPSSADLFAYLSSTTATGGAAVGWGRNTAGELGAGYWTNFSGGGEQAPVSVLGLSNVVGLSGGDSLSEFLLGDGTVWAVGGNGFGQLGNGGHEQEEKASPTQVHGFASCRARAIANTSAIRDNGTIVAWGRGIYGQLGNGPLSCESCAPQHSALVPQEVPGLSHVAQIAQGGGARFALLENGTLMAWGRNEHGMLGVGTFTGPQRCQAIGPEPEEACSTYPRPVVASWPSGVTVTAVAAGSEAAYALLSNGHVMAWGNNGKGQLGTGPANTNDQASPVEVVNLTGVVAVSGGYRHALALLNTGEVVGWGEDNVGEVGGSGAETCPQGTCDRTATRVSGLEHVTAISAGRAFSLALSAGKVYAFGNNEFGTLGLGTPGGPEVCGTVGCSRIPRAIEGLSPVRTVAAVVNHSLAILEPGFPGPTPLLSDTPESHALKIVWTYPATTRFMVRWEKASGGGLSKPVYLEGPPWTACSPAAPCSYVIGNLNAEPYKVTLKGERLNPKELESDRHIEDTPLG